MKQITLLFIALIIFGCSNDNSNDDSKNTDTVKLVKVVEVDNNDNETTTTILNYDGNKLDTSISTDKYEVFKTKFIYEKNKLVKLERTINYLYSSNNDLTIEYEGDNIYKTYGYDGSTTLFSHEYFYNSKGQLITDKQYDNNKYCCETNYTYDSNGNISGGSYDDKKNPMYYILPEAYSKIKEISKNNLLSDGTSTYAYEYNTEGFVTKKTETHKYFSKTIVTNYYYE